jgi:hypothetical protein
LEEEEEEEVPSKVFICCDCIAKCDRVIGTDFY